MCDIYESQKTKRGVVTVRAGNKVKIAFSRRNEIMVSIWKVIIQFNVRKKVPPTHRKKVYF